MNVKHLKITKNEGLSDKIRVYNYIGLLWGTVCLVNARLLSGKPSKKNVFHNCFLHNTICMLCNRAFSSWNFYVHFLISECTFNILVMWCVHSLSTIVAFRRCWHWKTQLMGIAKIIKHILKIYAMQVAALK